MTRQPFPTGFPLVVFATAKRRLQDAIRRTSATVVNTLLDPEQHSGEDLADIHARRRDIGLKPRDLKTTLGLERFDVKSPDMAHKTL